MKIWDYIKDKLFNRKKALPEPISKIEENNQSIPTTSSGKKAFDERVKVDIDIKPNTLDWAIDQYMAALIVQDNFEQRFNPYNALIKLGALKTLTSGNNSENEKQFLENIKEGNYGNNIELREQGSPKTEFYHICNDDKWAIGKNYRIYLNCKKENVAMIASRLVEELKDQKFYFKFNSNESNGERSEQFVFYTENLQDLCNKASIIDKVKNENPKLFEGANSLNPFLKVVDGYIGYAPETPEGEYINLRGETQYIDESYNSLLSATLEDSFTSSMKALAQNDLNMDITGYNLKQIINSKFLETIYQDDNLKRKFIESVKQNLKLASEKNLKLDIKGIENKTRLQQRTSEDYIPENY